MAIKYYSGINISGNIVPSADSTFNLGGPAFHFANVYADNLYGDGSNITNVTADSALALNVTVKNVSGGSLAKGTVVHAAPSANPPSGNVIEVIAADFDTAANMPGLGILNETLANEAEGEAIMFGAVSGIDTSSFTVGSELYVGNNGALTGTKPTGATQLIQKIAVVIKSHATNGTIKVFGAGRTNDVPNQINRTIEFSADQKFTDNSQIFLGSGNDFEIYHSGSHDFIRSIGTGSLYIDQATDDKNIVFRNDNGSGGLDNYIIISGSNENVEFFKPISGTSATFSSTVNLTSGVLRMNGSTVIGNNRQISALGASFTNPVTIYDTDTAENPRLSLGRQASESINFDVGDVHAVMYFKQDTDSNAIHTQYYTIDSDSTGEKVFTWQARSAAGGSANTYMSVNSSALTVNGNLNAVSGDFSGNVTIDGSLTVDGTIDLSNANLDIGQADIVFDIDSSTAGARGLVWDFDGDGNGISSYIGYIRAGGTAGERMDFNMNAEGSVTGNDTIYRFMNGGSEAVSIGANGNVVTQGYFTSNGYIQSYGTLYTRSDLRVLNSAGTGWTVWGTRNNGTYDLTVGTVDSSLLTTDFLVVDGVSWNSNKVSIQGASPNIEFRDTDTGSYWFQLGSNGKRFYVLHDTDLDGIFETTYPFELQSDTSVGLLYGSRIFADNYHPNADKWTTARTITLSGDLNGSVSIDGSSDVTLSAQVVNDSHTHDSRYYPKTESDVRYGRKVFGTNWGNTPEARYIKIEVPFIGGSGGSDMYFFDVYGYRDYGSLDSQLHYRVYIHARSNGTTSNNFNMDVKGVNVAANEEFKFAYKVVASSPTEVYINILEDYAGIQINSIPLDEGVLDNIEDLTISSSDTAPTGTTSVIPSIYLSTTDSIDASQLTGTVNAETLDGYDWDNVPDITVDGILLQDAADRSGLLEINRKGTSGWSGIQINHNGDHWSLMGNNSDVGMYDDHNGEWIWLYSENNELGLYYNGSEQARTQNGYFLATNEFRSEVFRGTNTVYHVTPAGTSNLNGLTLGGTLTLGSLTNDFTSTTALVNSGSGVVGQRSLGSLAFLSSVPSHTHDDRYYTESEMQTFFNRGYINSQSANNLAVGWYTIATNTGDRALGEFQIWDTASSDHQSVLFNASHHFGNDTSNDITVLANSRFSGTNFRYIRIKDGGTYDGAALQVYVDGSTNSVSVAIVGGNAQSSGWVLKDWIPDATDPGDLSNYSSFGVRCQVDLDLVISGGIITTGEIYSGGETTQFRVLNTGDEGPGNGLDADTVDGLQASQFLRSDAADTASGQITFSGGTRFPDTNGTIQSMWGIYGWDTQLQFTKRNLSTDGYEGTAMFIDYGGLYVQSDYSFRSPIFYDSNNTGYYLDPASTSVLNQTHTNFLLVNGTYDGYYGHTGMSWGGSTSYPTIYGSHPDRWVMFLKPHIVWMQNGQRGFTGSTEGSMIRFEGNLSSDRTWDLGCLTEIASGGDYFGAVRNIGSTTTWAFYADPSMNLHANSSMRAPIFYDSNNTSYYADPASTSNFNALNVGGSPVLREDNSVILRYRGSITSQDWNTYIDGTEGGWYRVLGMSGSNRPPAYTYGMALSMAYSGQSKVQLYFPETGSASNGIYVRTGWNTAYRDWRSIALHGVNPQTGGSLYADSFIDRNNTGYYVDPASQSNLNSLSLTGRFEPDDPDGYVSSTISGLTNAPIYYPESNVGTSNVYVPHTHSRTRYSSGYRAHISTGVHALASSWNYRYYIAQGGSDSNPTKALEFDVYNNNIYHSDGFIRSANDFHAPIFYDSNNTGYYCNPASTSRLNEIYADDVTTTQRQASPRWDTAFYVLQAQHWYGDTSSQTMYIGESGNTTHLRGKLSIGGTTVDSGYALSMNGSIRMYGHDVNHVSQLHFNDNVRFYDDGNDSYINFKYGDGNNGGIKFLNGNTAQKGYLYADNSGFGLLSANGTWAVRTTDSGVFIDHRTDSPIYYDSDNTAYYIDGASTSSLNALNATRIGVNPSGSSTSRYGISLYAGYNSGEPTYGLLFTGTSLGTHGAVTSDWATYFTMNNNTSRGWIFRRVGSGNCASISAGGTASFNGDVIAYYSDMRLKTKLGDIKDPISKIQALNGFYYEPNETAQSYGYEKETRVGLSAQEVEAVLPEIVTDAPIGDGYKTVDYAKLVPVLVEAIKEQQKQIDELKKLINP